MNFLNKFSKNTQIKLNENPSSESRIVPRTVEQIDTRDEANLRFSQFCERA